MAAICLYIREYMEDFTDSTWKEMVVNYEDNECTFEDQRNLDFTHDLCG